MQFLKYFARYGNFSIFKTSKNIADLAEISLANPLPSSVPFMARLAEILISISEGIIKKFHERRD